MSNFVQVKNNRGTGILTEVTVNGQRIACSAVDIRIRPDELVTAILEVPVEDIDMMIANSGVTIEPINTEYVEMKTDEQS